MKQRSLQALLDLNSKSADFFTPQASHTKTNFILLFPVAKESLFSLIATNSKIWVPVSLISFYLSA